MPLRIYKRGAESETLQFHTWGCSGGKGKSPGAEWSPGGLRATRGEAVPLLGGQPVEAVRPPHRQRCQQTGEQPHSLVLEQGR